MKNIKDREDIPRLYKNGLSCLEISKKVGLSRGAVHSILKVRGVRFRTFNEAVKIKYPEGRFGEHASNWRGGKRVASKGGAYIYAYAPQNPNATKDGYVMEHRLVMEKKLGRSLTRDEIVHHKNGNKKDNRIQNLELLESRGKHIQEHFSRSFKVEQVQTEIRRLRRLLKKHKIAY